jgi:20S proteasome alpha/beta subunit
MAVTFIVGLKCCDGIVLCTDSLEEDGITKKRVDKISLIGGAGWGLAIAGAGGGGIIDKFCGEVRTRLPRGAFDRYSIENTIEAVLAEFHANYTDQFGILAGVYSSPATYFLYRADASSNVLSPVADEAHIGTGNSLWRLISDPLYDHKNCVADNTRLAIFATRLATRYAAGVDEPIQVVSCTFGDQFWASPTQNEIKVIEAELRLDDFKDVLRGYWRMHNPPTRREQVIKYKGVRTPGDELTLLDGVKLEELYTVSGRRRASKICRRNTDKLQQRAIVEGKRYREAHPSASLPSSRNART